MSSYSISLVLVAMMLIGFALSVRANAATIDAVALWWALIYMPVIQLGSKFLLFWLHLDSRLPLWRQFVSLLCDIGGGLLLTPLLVYQHVTFVLGILLGKAVQWTSPSRNPNDGVTWGLAARVFWVPTLVAAVWIPFACSLAPAFLFFSGTILLPWLFSIPLAVVSANPRLGSWLAGTGLFACVRTDGELRELGELVEGTSDAWWRHLRPAAEHPNQPADSAAKAV
jgi:membrane glycosyltransferase